MFVATNAAASWFQFGETYNAIQELLKKIKADDKIHMIDQKNQFAVENEGFRYALAKCKGINVDKFYDQAKNSWNKTSQSIIKMTEIFLELQSYPTQSFADLRQSYDAVTDLCQEIKIIRYLIQMK